jgi:hypothetical protein
MSMEHKEFKDGERDLQGNCKMKIKYCKNQNEMHITNDGVRGLIPLRIKSKTSLLG